MGVTVENETAEVGGDKPSEGVETFTQDDVNRIVSERLERERKKFADYDELKSRVEELEKTNSDLSGENETLRSERESYEAAKKHEALIKSVAEEMGVDPTILSKMRGDTEDELRESAAVLKDQFQGTPPVDSQGEYPRKQSPSGEKKFVQELFK